MLPNEPNSTAVLLIALGLLMTTSVLFSRLAGRIGIPVALLFIAIGVAAGSEGFGGIEFEDYGFAFRIGTVALVLILFDGGLNTPLSSIKEGIWPAAVLATFGVVGTAALVALAARGLGFSWSQALLVGAVVSSTDAAAVFAVLRGSGVQLKKRVGITLELESGLNDPMAIILTISMTAALLRQQPPGWRLLLQAAGEMIVGAVIGLGLGYAGRELLKRVRLPAGGLYPVLSLSLAFLAFGLPTIFHGSGFLAVYLAAILLGNEAIRYRSGLLRVHDALAWLSQVTMFLALGLLVFPSRLLNVARPGLGLGLALAFIARPLAVGACLLPFRFSFSEMLYISWVGLRGAVPIILATYPVLAGVPGAVDVFDLVFFIVVVSALVPGATVKWLTRRLKLTANLPPPPQAILEINSVQPLTGELASFFIDAASAACGAAIAELPFPTSAAATLIVRGPELLAPKGETTLQPGDHVYVFCKSEDLPFLQLMFGQQEQK